MYPISRILYGVYKGGYVIPHSLLANSKLRNFASCQVQVVLPRDRPYAFQRALAEAAASLSPQLNQFYIIYCLI